MSVCSCIEFWLRRYLRDVQEIEAAGKTFHSAVDGKKMVGIGFFHHKHDRFRACIWRNGSFFAG